MYISIKKAEKITLRAAANGYAEQQVKDKGAIKSVESQCWQQCGGKTLKDTIE